VLAGQSQDYPGRWLLMAANDPADLVGNLAGGFLDSRCLHVVADLGVPDAVRDGPRTLASLAGELGVDEAALGRVIRHLAGWGLARRSEPGAHLS
jgi:hypothetical protein